MVAALFTDRLPYGRGSVYGSGSLTVAVRLHVSGRPRPLALSRLASSTSSATVLIVFLPMRIQHFLEENKRVASENFVFGISHYWKVYAYRKMECVWYRTRIKFY